MKSDAIDCAARLPPCYKRLVKTTNWTRRSALVVAGIAVAGMGLTVGCSAKQAPAPTAPAQNSVDSKRPQGDVKPEEANPQKPVKAKPAPTAKPGNTPGDN